MPVVQEFDEFIADMEKLSREFGNDFEPALRECYPIVQRDIEDHFDAAEGSNGTWPLHSPVTIARYGPHPLLILTGALAAAATGTGTGHVVQFDTSEMTYGVERGVIPYAGIHQDGGGNIPQREYLWFSEEAVGECTGVVMSHAMAMLNQ